MLSLLPMSTSFTPFVCHPSRPSCVVARFYHPSGRHFIPLSPRREVVAAGSMGAQGGERGGMWCSTVGVECGVLHGGGVGGRGRGAREYGGREGWTIVSPLRIPHLAPRHTGANVKRFRDVKADTRVAHLGPTTSQSGNARDTRVIVDTLLCDRALFSPLPSLLFPQRRKRDRLIFRGTVLDDLSTIAIARSKFLRLEISSSKSTSDQLILIAPVVKSRHVSHAIFYILLCV